MTETLAAIRRHSAAEPHVGVVLGSGLEGFANELSGRVEISYTEIPGWPHSTVAGHAGKLVLGKLGDLEIAVLCGRAHLYEGRTPAEVTFGVRALASLGAQSVVLTNAAGGINLGYRQGSLVLISDHLNLQGTNPLVGPSPSFPDMSEIYSKRYREIARNAAAEMGIDIPEGIYAGLLGPSFETPAEIRYLRTIGADLVGMSTVAEAIVANALGLSVLGISCVTNMAAGVEDRKLSHAEVLETGQRVRGTLVALLKKILPRL